MTFYSQAKQDEVLWEALFKDADAGYFVDVGAHDGVTFSNTYMLEREANWRGVCIEPHPSYFDALRLNRPFSDVIQAAAGPQNLPSVTLYATPFGFLSTVDKDEVKPLDGAHGYNGAGRTAIQIPMMTLDTILHQVKAPEKMELVCIDTEGYEIEVLKGFTLNYWQPRIMLMEAYDAKHRAALTLYMADKGYFFGCTLGVDLAYCRDGKDAERLRMYGAK